MKVYPKTASEYANQINQQHDVNTWGGKLSEDPEHWAEYGVYTGEDLAKYLAIEEHNTAYKEVWDMKPRHINYDNFSIEDIEADTKELRNMKQNESLVIIKKLIKEEIKNTLEEQDFQFRGSVNTELSNAEKQARRSPRFPEWKREYIRARKTLGIADSIAAANKVLGL